MSQSPPGAAEGPSAAAAPKRKPLRTIAELILLLVLVIVLGGVAWLRLTGAGQLVWEAWTESGSLEAERAAADALRERGALVIVTSGFVTSVSFRLHPVDDEVMRQVGALARLDSLDLSLTNVRGEQLRYLARHRWLASLVLGGTQVDDEGIGHLKGLEELYALHLTGTPVTDEGLVQLGSLPNLRILDLSRTRVTDEGLKHLAGFPRLDHLLLAGTAVSEAGIRELATATPGLKRLTLDPALARSEATAALKKALPGLFVDAAPAAGRSS